nr:MAG TPA: hypothetical protein [Caudoviricetes sp.]
MDVHFTSLVGRATRTTICLSSIAVTICASYVAVVVTVLFNTFESERLFISLTCIIPSYSKTAPA